MLRSARRARLGARADVDVTFRLVPHSAVEPRQILRDKIAADHLLIGVDQALSDLTRHSACTKGSTVQAAYAANAQARRGQKAFVRGVGVVEVEILLRERDPELAGK